MGDYTQCTDLPGLIYAALDKIFEHATKAAQAAYKCTASGRVDRDDCTQINVELIEAMAAMYPHLEKAKRYASMIECAQDVAEAIAKAIENDNKEQAQ